MAESPVRVAYYYRTRWGAHAEFIELFTRNHWPILREQLRDGRFLAVTLDVPRFHGDGRADWDVPSRSSTATGPRSRRTPRRRSPPGSSRTRSPTGPRSSAALRSSRRTGTCRWSRWRYRADVVASVIRNC